MTIPSLSASCPQEAIVNLMLHWCGKMGRPELKANITVAKLREAAVECSE